MVSHWSLSHSKSHQINWSPLSILAKLNNALVGIVSILLSFPSPQVPVSILWLLYQEHQLKLISPSLSCFTIFSISEQSWSNYLFCLFFFKSTILHVLFFCCCCCCCWLLWVLDFLQRLGDRLYLKMFEESMHDILHKRLWVRYVVFAHIANIM